MSRGCHSLNKEHHSRAVKRFKRYSLCPYQQPSPTENQNLYDVFVVALPSLCKIINVVDFESSP